MEQQDYSQYMINYTQDAKDGKFPELVGRDKELERLIHILLRNTKNNPVVVGPSGIGKSALLQGLISFMTSENAPEYMQSREVIGIDVAKIMLDAPNDVEYTRLVEKVLQIMLTAWAASQLRQTAEKMVNDLKGEN